MNETAALRVRLKMLDRTCYDLLAKMDRVGPRSDLLRSYITADNMIVHLRHELVEMLRHEFAVRRADQLQGKEHDDE